MPCGGPSYPHAVRHETGTRSFVVDALQEGADQSGLVEIRSWMDKKGWRKRNQWLAAARHGLLAVSSVTLKVLTVACRIGIAKGSVCIRAAEGQGGGTASTRHRWGASRLSNACACPVPGH
jgi:hypothetical protein